jgi:hypothetical protein
VASLTHARQNLAQEVERVIPPDDPLRPLLDRIGDAMAALEDAEARIGQSTVDQLARAAAYGARQHVVDIVRSETRKRLVWLSACFGLTLGFGVIIGMMLQR